ncbi:Crp/Fnr family transcriptional regulator [Arcticibacter sp.]|jgi:CRP-like cAMP-binding protein|uniref:Crp/Fnr family transcriptional regulator n=1 Tax=Arcticibacter sp. TaxID=1872630 RepID=UPI00388E5DDB
MLDEKTINHYKDFFELELTELLSLLSLTREKSLKEGDVYIQEGSLTRRLAYIQKGLIRTVYLKENGDETTMLLRWEDQFFSSYDSIFFNRPSRFTYQALEDTVVLEANYDDFMDFLNTHPRFAKAKDFFLISMLAEAMERVESFVLMTPEERYLNLIKDKGDIVQRCQDKHLATWLGITPVSLSRIRKRIAEGGER